MNPLLSKLSPNLARLAQGATPNAALGVSSPQALPPTQGLGPVLSYADIVNTLNRVKNPQAFQPAPNQAAPVKAPKPTQPYRITPEDQIVPVGYDPNIYNTPVSQPQYQQPLPETPVYQPVTAGSTPTTSEKGGYTDPTVSAPTTPATPASPATDPTAGLNIQDMDPVSRYYALRGKQMDDRILNKGLYKVDPNAGYSPDQVRQIQNSADDVYGSQLKEIGKQIANEATSSSAPSPIVVNGQTYNLDKNQYKLLMPLQSEFEKNAKDSLAVINTFHNMGGLASTRSAPGQMALIFSFMKSLDPTSTVREAEYANAANTRGVPDTIWQFFDKVKNGNILTPDQVTKFLEVAGSQASVAKNNLDSLAKDYDTRASVYGIPNGIFSGQINTRASLPARTNANTNTSTAQTTTSSTTYSGPTTTVQTKVGTLNLAGW